MSGMSALAAGPRSPAARGGTLSDVSASRIAHIRIFTELREAEPAWRALAPRATVSPYQTYAWIAAWCSSPLADGLTPAVAVAYDGAGQPIALLPLGCVRRAGLRVGVFLGGREANANLGLFDPRIAWDPATVRRLARQVATTAGLDLFDLRNQPGLGSGHPNPLLGLGCQPSPSATRSAVLAAEPESYLRTTLSKHARKALRQKEARLQALGPVVHRRATNAAEVARFIDAYLVQKAARSSETGRGGLRKPDDIRRFLTTAAAPQDGMPAAVELHALLCGDAIVAVFGGAGCETRFSGMFIAFDARPAVARCSPGDLLIAAVIADLCRRGFGSFDLGIGEARYKETFCDTVEPLFDTLAGMTVTGRVAAPVWAGLLRVKRALKQSRVAWPLLLRGQAFAARLRSSVPRAPD